MQIESADESDFVGTRLHATSTNLQVPFEFHLSLPKDSRKMKCLDSYKKEINIDDDITLRQEQTSAYCSSKPKFSVKLYRGAFANRVQVLRLERKSFHLTFNFLLAWFHFLTLGNN